MELMGKAGFTFLSQGLLCEVPSVEKAFHLCGEVALPIFFLVFRGCPPNLEEWGGRAEALEEERGDISWLWW